MELQGGSPALWEEIFDAFNTVLADLPLPSFPSLAHHNR
jgi:hypothetical protein